MSSAQADNIDTFSSQPSLAFLPPLLERLEASLDYEVDRKEVTAAVMAAVREAAISSGIDYEENEHSRARFYTGVACGDKMYPHHPLDVKIHIATYTWLAIVIDDKTPSMLDGVEAFQQLFFSNLPQRTPILELFARNLKQTHEYFDPIAARFIILSSLAFLNICVLEARKEYQSMGTKKGGDKWAWYFRDKEGICEAYAYFCFPKATCPDISVFLQAIPDMCIPVNFINDIFSFYKEVLAGEKRNYVNKRAKYSGTKDFAQVMQEMFDELVASHERVCLVLKGHDAYEKAWRGYVNGYITMHKVTPRYKLRDIGLALL